jgi:hypothetical protein
MSTIFLVCAIPPASSRHQYTPDGKPEASKIITIPTDADADAD